MRAVLVFCCFVPLAWAQRQPDLSAQREAMQKLSFLTGKWSGEALILEGSDGPLKIRQTEDVQYKLDGLVMLVEGTGTNLESGQVVFRALATIAYDEATKTYRFRAYSRGRYLDTELKSTENRFEWGFQAGPATVRNIMRLNEKGEWYETTEVTVGNNPPRRTLEMAVRREK